MTFATGFMLFICLAFFGIMIIGVLPSISSPEKLDEQEIEEREKSKKTNRKTKD